MSRLARLIGVVALMASLSGTVMADNAGSGNPHIPAFMTSLLLAAGGLF